MSSSDTATFDGPTSEAESQSEKSLFNTAAISGAVGGGVVLAVMLSLVMYIVIWRQFREARHPFVDELGDESAGERNDDPDNDRVSRRHARHAARSLVWCCGNDNWGLHGKISPRL
jgi:hypothetical protein